MRSARNIRRIKAQAMNAARKPEMLRRIRAANSPRTSILEEANSYIREVQQYNKEHRQAIKRYGYGEPAEIFADNHRKAAIKGLKQAIEKLRLQGKPKLP